MAYGLVPIAYCLMSFVGADDLDLQFLDCESVKILQFQWNNNAKYARASLQMASGEHSDDDDLT